MDKAFDAALVWFRRDLRLHDHAALHHALRQARRVWCAFVFDTDTLDALPRADRRVEFIRDSLDVLDAELAALGLAQGRARVGLLVRHGKAVQEIPALAQQLHVQAVFANRDYDPAGKARDARVLGALAHAGIAFHTAKDQVIFETDELLTTTGMPYSMFTPYKNNWLRQVDEERLAEWPVERHAASLAPLPEGLPRGVPTLAELGFQTTNLHALRLQPGEAGAQAMLADFLQRIDHYHEARDFPAVKGPSYLSVHLRFGTLSVRQLARAAHQRMQQHSRGAAMWLNELIWRDFYQQLLHHHPRVVTHAFRPEYDAIRWEQGRQADALFAAWCEGRTGYPLVDAAMHQLNQTGYMHNRLRMVTASFLCKHLGIDWRRGERYFAEKLNDHDLAANNGGWQWAASTGCDAQPYFRIFNPVSQGEKYDPQGKFVRRYLPQLAALPDRLIHAPWQAREADLCAAGIALGRDYPRPIVDHGDARLRTQLRFEAVKKPRA